MKLNVKDYRQAVERAVSKGELRRAIGLLENMAPGNAHALRSELQAIGQDYGRVIDYALTGNPDPSRAEQLEALKMRIYTALDLTIREAEIVDTPTLYYNTARTERLRPQDSIPALAARLGKDPDAERRLFERVWTTVPLRREDVDSLIDAIVFQDEEVLISALTLNGLQFYSEATLLALLRCAESPLPRVRIRATVGAVLVMARWPRRSDSRAVRNLLAALRDGGNWSRDVEEVILQLIRMADLGKLTKEINEELMPEILKTVKPSDLSPEMNPEWQEMLEQSGLHDKLAEFSRKLENSGDMLYATFSQLKQFSFFDHPMHWFIPFDAERPEVVASVTHKYEHIADLLKAAPVMCDSDKYSFLLALRHLPEAQVEQMSLMVQNLPTGSAPDELSLTRQQLVASTMQDLYRFFNLFRRKGEFENPFASVVNPTSLPVLAVDFSEEDTIRAVAEFFFKRGHWAEAAALFAHLSPDATVLQKQGHALRRLGRHAEALEAFERADMLLPDSPWTLRQIGATRRLLGDQVGALEAYTRLDALEPDQLPTAMAIGQINLELGRHREALHSFYRAEFIDEESVKPIRAIAWALFLNGDFDQSQKYYTRLMQKETPQPADYMNLGHLSLALGQVREALNFYRLYTDDPAKLRQTLEAERPILQAAGIDTSIIPLLLDATTH